MISAAKRRLPLEGLLNTRELGGYPVLAGGKEKIIKKGLIYRSGSPEYASLADIKILENLNIKTTADFRSDGEKTSFFNLSSLVQKAELPIDAGNLMGLVFRSGDWHPTAHSEGPESEMLSLYALMPEEAIPPYRELFKLLADPANSPILIHCSAGKDRTGLACALILHILGASTETIMEDYLYSNENLRPYWERFIKSKPYLIPYYTVTEKYINAAFMVIEKKWGMDTYLTKVLGADPGRLQEIYLE